MSPTARRDGQHQDRVLLHVRGGGGGGRPLRVPAVGAAVAVARRRQLVQGGATSPARALCPPGQRTPHSNTHTLKHTHTCRQVRARVRARQGDQGWRRGRAGRDRPAAAGARACDCLSVVCLDRVLLHRCRPRARRGFSIHACHACELETSVPCFMQRASASPRTCASCTHTHARTHIRALAHTNTHAGRRDAAAGGPDQDARAAKAGCPDCKRV